LSCLITVNICRTREQDVPWKRNR